MNKKQAYVFILYFIVEIYVFFLPLPAPKKIIPPTIQPSTVLSHQLQNSEKRSSFDEDEYPERIDIASWVSIFFFLLYIAATFYHPDKISNSKEKL